MAKYKGSLLKDKYEFQAVMLVLNYAWLDLNLAIKFLKLPKTDHSIYIEVTLDS